MDEPQKSGARERRGELRYGLGAKVMVRKPGGESIAAIACNVSAAGMMLVCEELSGFGVGDEVVVEIEMPDHLPRSLFKWGIARIVHADAGGFGIQLQAGIFAPGD